MYRKIILMCAIAFSFPSSSLALTRWPMTLSQEIDNRFQECQKGNAWLVDFFNKKSKVVTAQPEFLNSYTSQFLNTVNDPYVRVAVVTALVIYAWQNKKTIQKRLQTLRKKDSL